MFTMLIFKAFCVVPANVSQVSSNGLEKERGGVKTCITAGYCVKTNWQKVY